MELTIARDTLFIKARILQISGGDVSITATNSLNLPPPNLSPVGSLTLHPTQDLILAADRDIIETAGRDLTIHADRHATISSTQDLNLTASNSTTLGGPLVQINATNNLNLTSTDMLITATNVLGINATQDINITTSSRDIGIVSARDGNLQCERNLTISSILDTTVQTGENFRLIARNSRIDTDNLNLNVSGIITVPTGTVWQGSFQKQEDLLVTLTGSVLPTPSVTYLINTTRSFGSQIHLSITLGPMGGEIFQTSAGNEILFNYINIPAFKPVKELKFPAVLLTVSTSTFMPVILNVHTDGSIGLSKLDHSNFTVDEEHIFYSGSASWNAYV